MKRKYLVISILILLIILSVGVIFIINKSIIFKLNGDKKITIEVNTKYIDGGFKAKLFNKNINKYVAINSNLKEDTLGKYNIVYTLDYLWFHYELIRTIEVIDNTKPNIFLNGNKSIVIYMGDEYKELGATAKDNYDNDISNKIIINNNIDLNKEGTYYVEYKVKDSSKNTNSIKREVIVKRLEKQSFNDNPINKYIEENKYDVSLGYYNLVNGTSYFFNENKVYFAASLIKTVEALYLYDNNMVNQDTLPYIKKAISISDNPSHHYLQKLIGQDKLKKYGKSLGANYTLSGGGVCGYTTVNDQLIFLKRLYEITKDKNEELKSFFMNDYGNYIKFDENIPVMHKYGYYNQVYHDVGIVLDEEPYIIIILTEEINDYSNIINSLSKIVYNYHKDN